MAEKKLLTHTLPDGAIAKRRTAHDYKAVIIGREDLAGRRKILVERDSMEWKNEFEFFHEYIVAGVGGTHKDLPRNAVTKEEYDKAVSVLMGATTAQEFGEKRNAEILKCFDQQHKRQKVGHWQVLAWAKSLEAAQKRVPSLSNGMRIIRAVPIAKQVI